MRLCFSRAICLLGVACSVAPAQQTATPAKGKKVCVADIANSSMQPMFTDRVKQALVDALQNQNVNAENTYTVTMLATHLALSGNNKIVFRREKCDFMLLSEVAKAQVATVTGSGANPATPMNPGDQRGASPLSFDFALFKKGRPSASVREDSIPIAASNDPTSAASGVVEKIASEVMAALKSK